MTNSSESTEWVQSEGQLMDLLTRPSETLKQFIPTVNGRLVVLGAGGKMGPTLCILAQRAADEVGHALEIVAISRFSNKDTQEELEGHGITTLKADLLNRDAVQKLPDAPNVINMTGLKFGTATNPGLTWAMNTLAPAFIAEQYADSRIVALSTGNVYPLVPVADGGAKEEQPLTPLGEYANAAVARERIYEYFSNRNGTRIARIRLNYAVELRYGVLVDIASRVWNEQPIDVTNGWFNCIWQGDANEMILRSLDLASTPASAWNLSCPEPLRARTVAEQFGELFGKTPMIEGSEASDALVCNPSKICAELGAPRTPLDQVIEWTAHWIKKGGSNLGKPTGFEVRDGTY